MPVDLSTEYMSFARVWHVREPLETADTPLPYLAGFQLSEHRISMFLANEVCTAA